MQIQNKGGIAMDLKQRRLLKTKEFKIVENGVRYFEKGPGNSLEGLYRFEDIGTDKISQKITKKGWLYGAIFLFLLSVILFVDELGGSDVESGAGLFYFSFAIVCLGLYFFTSADYMYLTGDNMAPIQFFRSKPNPENVENFIDEVLNARKIYLKNKYAKVDPDIPAQDQIYSFINLREQGIITKEEFENLKNDLGDIDNKIKQPVGFVNTQE